MNQSFILPHQLKSDIRGVLAKHLDLTKYQIFLFGSHAKGNATERSDIDIGIVGPTALDGYRKIEIEDELERIRTLLKFDLVDFSKSTATFRNQALQHIEPL